ncbi:MAG: TerB family tellurite resistance protein [Pseudomonadota bacterium]
MLERLRAFLGDPSVYHTPLPEADAAHAMGALLVRAAKADRVYVFEEIALIDRVLGIRHGLNPIDAAKMRAECELLEKAIPEAQDVGAILENAISTQEKEAVLRALWQVVHTDGRVDKIEDALLHRVEGILGVTPARAKELQIEAMKCADG